jgi:hypothetical protein
MKSAFLKMATIGFLTWSLAASAQDYKLGAQIGAIGLGNNTGIGFGGFIQVAPYETVGLRVDGTLANIDGMAYMATSPMLIFFVPTTEEFKAGFLAGAGFYKFGDTPVKFGIGGGVSGEFLVAKNLSVGGLFQMHNVFDSYDNVWNVFLTMNLTFGGEDGGWNW